MFSLLGRNRSVEISLRVPAAPSSAFTLITLLASSSYFSACSACHWTASTAARGVELPVRGTRAAVAADSRRSLHQAGPNFLEMGCSTSRLEERLDSIDAKLSVLAGGGGRPGKSARTDGKYDLFVSHAKKLPESEDRAVWIADVAEGHGLVPFFDRSNLKEISTTAIDEAVLKSEALVTVIDPFTFDSEWVFHENLLAANEGIPIVPVYDADRFRWDGQLDKHLRLHKWAFKKPAIPLTKSQRHESVRQLLEAVDEAVAAGRKPPAQKIEAKFRARVAAKVGVGGSQETDTLGAIDTAHKAMLNKLGGQQPSLIICAFTCTHEAEAVAKRVHELSPTVPMIGCTSCRGVVLNERWITHNKKYALGLWGLCDDGGAYITIHIKERPSGGGLRDEVYAQASSAMRQRGGDDSAPPSFAVLLGSPGNEEAILDGLTAALGGEVPILGGSAADNDVTSGWHQIAVAGRSGVSVGAPSVSSNGITIAVCWASCQTATTLTSGFKPTGCKAKVTKVDESDHGRTILEVDEGWGSGPTPIRDVYDKWSKGAILKGAPYKDGVATVLASSSFCPLGEVDGSYVRVMHPAFMHETSGSLTTFADARVGMEVTMLDAAPESLAKLISRSAKGLITDAMGASGGDASAFEPHEVIGALNIFCGGLVMAIDDSMPVAAQQLAEVVGHNNAMGICCFGEQGMDNKRRACHGNLMFGCLLFSNKPRDEASFKKSGQLGQVHDSVHA